MTKKYAVDLVLKLDLIEAGNKDELDEKVNRYIDKLAKQEDDSLTWSEVDWSILYVEEEETE